MFVLSYIAKHNYFYKNISINVIYLNGNYMRILKLLCVVCSHRISM